MSGRVEGERMEDLASVAFLGPLCAFFSSVTWAVGSAGYSKISRQYSPFAVNFTRALIALPLFVLSAFIVSGGLVEGIANYSKVRWSHWGWFTLSMFSSYGLGDTLFLWSTRSLGVPGALAIGSCFPIWTVLAGYLVYHEDVSLIKLLGLGISVFGAIVVILNGPQGLKNSRDPVSQQEFPWGGFLLAVATSFMWATNSFSVARGGADLIAPVGNTVRMIMALVLSAGFSRIFVPGTSLVLPHGQVLKSWWIFVLEAFGGSYLYMFGLAHSSLAVGSTLSSLAPVISVPVAILLGLERFSKLRTLGVVIVAFGIWLLVGPF